ncbi:winged helix DNA-binding domain-containing protein [Longispora albida]|uniref:winged helix DNA-binding domain-containing protein n=1 Tax=Longispora albida TaxID=203523 RepID=UPI000367E381|nr:winged helix DNA-binding domain-containing protein [Longispora albida]
MKHIDTAERRARLAARHFPADTSAEAITSSLVALHSTDPASVYLSVIGRGGTETGLEAALYEQRSLVRMAGMRRTLFVVPAGDVPVLQASTTSAIAAKERKGLTQFIVDGGFTAQWLAEVEGGTLAALRETSDVTASELGDRVPGLKEQIPVAVGKPYETKQGVSTRLMYTLSAEGKVVRGRPRGSWLSGQYRWSLAEPIAEVPVAEAQAAWVRRWLEVFGPGTEADIKWWTGWTLTAVRKALGALGAEQVGLDGGTVGYVLPGDTEPAPGPKRAAVLPALDPTPMGWQERGWYLDPAHKAELFDRTGNIGPTIWWGGEIVGGWAQRGDGEVAYRLLATVDKAAVKAIEAELGRVGAWLAGHRVTPRFRTPLERELSA